MTYHYFQSGTVLGLHHFQTEKGILSPFFLKSTLKKAIDQEEYGIEFKIVDYSGPYKGKIYFPTSSTKGEVVNLPDGCSDFQTYTVEISLESELEGEVLKDLSVIMNGGVPCDIYDHSYRSYGLFEGWWFQTWAPGCDCEE